MRFDRHLLAAAAATSMLVSTAFAQTAYATARASDDIVDTAIAAGQFKTLVTAVKAAGLVDALKGAGPFTVFAPTDAAFAKIDQDTLKSLLEPSNRDQLVAILKHHVVSGRYPAAKVTGSESLKTLNGTSLAIDTSSGVKVGGANVVKADIDCSNGVIHVVDTVILPPAAPNIVELAAGAGTFNTLLTAAKAAGLAEALAGDGPFTVFAPTDEAFSKIAPETLQSLLKPENKAKLQAILKYHVVSGAVDARNAVIAGEAATLQGGKVKFSIVDGRLMVNGAKVIGSDLTASNGVVHVIDTVILPE